MIGGVSNPRKRRCSSDAGTYFVRGVVVVVGTETGALSVGFGGASDAVDDSEVSSGRVEGDRGHKKN
jgi:hypothetical protein